VCLFIRVSYAQSTAEFDPHYACYLKSDPAKELIAIGDSASGTLADAAHKPAGQNQALNFARSARRNTISSNPLAVRSYHPAIRETSSAVIARLPSIPRTPLRTPALAELTEFSLGFWRLFDLRFIGRAAARNSTPTDKSADRSK
jgi:hypothetical protein